MQAVLLDTSSTIVSWNMILWLWANEHDGENTIPDTNGFAPLDLYLPVRVTIIPGRVGRLLQAPQSRSYESGYSGSWIVVHWGCLICRCIRTATRCSGDSPFGTLGDSLRIRVRVKIHPSAQESGRLRDAYGVRLLVFGARFALTADLCVLKL